MTTYRNGDRITVRDFNGKQWPAIFRSEIGQHDKAGILFEINGQVSRAERKNVKKA